jgi:glycosyltransferase involved in cell wall biosynthesis
MRIAYLARASGNGHYRGIGPMTALAQSGAHEVRALPDDTSRPLPVSAVQDVDVLHIHRYSDDRVQRLARTAKEHGAIVVWDDDDDLASMPKGVAYQREWTGFAGNRRLVTIKRLFRLTDLVTTPSPTLAERLRGNGAPHTEVIENFVPDQFLHPDRRPHRGVTIGWVAGLEHQMDVERLPIRGVLQRLLDERTDVNVIAIGLELGLRSERYGTVASVPLLNLPAAIAHFDIGIAPLAELDFNLARSNVKLKEYGAVGVPWLASPIGPYAELGEQQGGRLVADDAWHEQLTRLIDKPRERRKLAKRAAKWAAGETISKHAHRWETCFAAAIERARAAA